MERRTFLALTLAAIATAVAGDVEELLWTPKKTIFIPPATPLISVNVDASREAGCWHDGLRGWGAGDFLTSVPEWQLRAKYPDIAAMLDNRRRILYMSGWYAPPATGSFVRRVWERSGESQASSAIANRS